MPPPQLPRDAPVVDVPHPLEVGLRVHLRRELDVPFDRDRLRDSLAPPAALNHCQKPLIESRGSITAPVRCETGTVIV